MTYKNDTEGTIVPEFLIRKRVDGKSPMQELAHPIMETDVPNGSKTKTAIFIRHHETHDGIFYKFHHIK